MTKRARKTSPFWRAGAAVSAMAVLVGTAAPLPSEGQVGQGPATKAPGDGPDASGRSIDVSPLRPRPGTSYGQLRPPADDGRLRVVVRSPQGQLNQVDQASEIRVAFDRPVVELAAIDQRADASRFVTVTPEVPGVYRWASTRVLVFTPAARLRSSTRYDVTVQGISGLDGAALAQPVRFSFDTPRVACELFGTDEAFNRAAAGAQLLVTCDQPVDGRDVAAHTTAAFRPTVFDAAPFRPAPEDLAEMRRVDPAGVERLEAALARFAQPARPQPGQREDVRQVTWTNSGRCPGRDERRTCQWLQVAGEIPLDAQVAIRFANGIKSGLGPLTSVGVPPATATTTSMPLVGFSSCRDDCNPFSVDGLDLRAPFTERALDGKVRVTDLATGRTAAFDADRDDTSESTSVSLSWANLSPGGRYRIEVDPTITSANGRSLGYRSVTTVSLGQHPWAIGVPQGEAILESARTKGLDVGVHNVKALDSVVRRLSADEMVGVLKELRANAEPARLPGFLANAASRPLTIPSKVNENQTVTLPAAEGPGVYVVAVKATAVEPKSDYDDALKKQQWRVGLVQVTDVAATIKRSPVNVLVSVTALSTGKAVPSARVALHADLTGRPYWSGQADANGFVTGPPPPLPCGACELIAVVESAGQVGYTSTQWGLGGNFPIDAIGRRPGRGESVPAPDSVPATVELLAPGERVSGTAFTDRGVYKAGEEVHVKGLVRIEQPRGLRLPSRLKEAAIQVTDDRGTAVWSSKVALDDSAGYEASFTLAADARLGDYLVSTDGVSTSFLVTSFRRPDFQVDVATSKPEYLQGEQIDGTVDGRYLFGAAMAGRDSQWSIRADSMSVDPTNGHPELGLIGYSWAYVCIRFDADCPDGSGDLADAKAALDIEGRVKATHRPAPIRGRHTPLSITLEGTVTDVNRQVIANRATAIVHPGQHYLGVKADTYFGNEGKPLKAKGAAVTPNGRWKPGVEITATLVRWEWRGFDQSPVAHPEGTTTFTSGQAAVPFELTPKRSGQYEIRLTSTDALGNGLEAGTFTYVTGRDAIRWSFPNGSGVEVVPERETYAVGDTARVLVKSIWPTAEGMVTIERGETITARRFRIDGSTATLDIPVTADHVPNVVVAVTLFRGRVSLPKAAVDDQGNPDDGRPLVRSGRASLKVPPLAKALKVAVKADARDYRPGTPATATVTVADAAGRPAAGEVTLWAVDEGVLRLSGYTVPDLLASLYAERPVVVETSDGRARLSSIEAERDKTRGGLLGEYRADESASAGAGAPSPAVRRKANQDLARTDGGDDAENVALPRSDFRVLAHWQGRLRIGNNGSGTARITLPQSLSTYRIIAVASNGADRFGGGDTTVEIRQPFMVQPSLPRFVALGDTFEAGAVIQNQAGTAGTASLTLQLPTDAPVQVDGPITQTMAAPVGPTEVRFRLRAIKVGALNLTIRGTLDVGGRKETDAVQAGLPVLLTRRFETVAAAGTVQAGGAPDVEQVRLPAGVIADQGGLDVQASSSALAGLQNGVEYLVDYPYGCLEQRSSRVRSLVMLGDLQQVFPLPQLDGGTLRKTVQDEIARFPSYATDSGGLAYWEGGDVPDIFLSARVLVLLLDAQALGYTVPGGLIDGLVAYLQEVLEEVDAEPNRPADDSDGYWLNRAHVLYALARAGKADLARNGRLWLRRHELSTLERLHLLRAMLEAGETGDRPATMYGELRNSLRIEADQAFLQDDEQYERWACPCLRYLFADDVHLTAELLSTVVLIDPADRLAPQMARWLLAQRKDGKWSNTLENGYALTALVSYYRAAEPQAPEFRATVALGAVKAYEGAFAGRSLDVKTGSIPMARLGTAFADPTKSVPLTVSAAGKGTLHWSARLRYAPETRSLKPLDAGFAVTRAYRPVRGGAAATTFAAGDVVSVQLTVRTAQVRRNVVIDDALPAGLEALNEQLSTTSQTELRGGGATGADGGWLGIDHTEVHDDRILLFATQLDPGTLTYTYLARATAPGTYVAAPTQAEEMYRPEIFGRTGASIVTVTAP